MHKTLMLKAFEKAKNDLITKGVLQPSKVAMADVLSDYISENTDTCLGEKRFRGYYDNARRLEKSKNDIVISQFAVVEALCCFLGFSSYEEFVKSIDKKKRKWLVYFFATLGIAGVLILLCFSLNRPNWMEWKNDRYEVVSFGTEILNDGSLKIIKEDRLENLKKVNSTKFNTPYCNTYGAVNMWYGKNNQGELEVFTSFDLDPVTGKTLKPIKDYMIKNIYVLNTNGCNIYFTSYTRPIYNSNITFWGIWATCIFITLNICHNFIVPSNYF